MPELQTWTTERIVRLVALVLLVLACLQIILPFLGALAWGAIIAITGCFQGMLVEGNAEEVGLKTTAAVVQAIFLVIVLDAFFAVFFTWIGWV